MFGLISDCVLQEKHLLQQRIRDLERQWQAQDDESQSVTTEDPSEDLDHHSMPAVEEDR